LLIDRSGKVDQVVVGDAQRVFLPDLGRERAGAGRFRGVRLVLSNLHPDGLSEDDLTDLALLRLDAVLTVHVLKDGLPGAVHYAHLLPPEAEALWRVHERPSVHGWDEPFDQFIQDLEDQFRRSPRLLEVQDAQGVILVGITLAEPERAKRTLAELERLAETAGLRVLDAQIQRRRKLDGRTCIGKGKLQELVLRSMHLGAEVLIFDRELSPSQLRNIATLTDLSVLDRTQLILDIFAQHATSREGKLQVELAQLRYRMPRLALMPTAMSRLTGGIGGRGPGESKLEINRRRAQERLARLEKQLKQLAKGRSTRRARRKRGRIPIVSIVGYTNAGKSTLLNRLTHSKVLTENKLFATLDPTTRRLRFPEEREIIITDTVGFIEDLPSTLIAAFRSTLEELEEADLLLHVLDVSDPSYREHERAVHKVLEDLGLQDRPVIRVWNKADRVSPVRLSEHLEEEEGWAVSALDGSGCDVLLEQIESALFSSSKRYTPRPKQST
jgi:GTP-binding protein HflX